MSEMKAENRKATRKKVKFTDSIFFIIMTTKIVVCIKSSQFFDKKQIKHLRKIIKYA